MSILHKAAGFAVSVVALVSTSIPTSAAHAATPISSRSMLVSYGHLDLGRAGAIDAVYRQLTVAAARACGAYESRNLRARDDWRRCRDAALSEVVAHFVEARIATLPTNDGVEVAVLRSN